MQRAGLRDLHANTGGKMHMHTHTHVHANTAVHMHNSTSQYTCTCAHTHTHIQIRGVWVIILSCLYFLETPAPLPPHTTLKCLHLSLSCGVTILAVDQSASENEPAL